MIRYFSNLRVRLILPVLLAMVPASSLSVWAAWQVRERERVAVEQDALHQAQLTAGISSAAAPRGAVKERS